MQNILYKNNGNMVSLVKQILRTKILVLEELNKIQNASIKLCCLWQEKINVH